MRVVLGLLAAAGAFVFSVLMLWLAGLVLADGYPSLHAERTWLAVSMVLSAGVSAWIFRRVARLARPGGRVAAVAAGAITVGSAGFALGFFGPLLLSDGDQGPLLGLLVTGPLGALAGGLWGAASWARRQRAGGSAGRE